MFVELPLPRPDAEERTERHLAMAAKLADLAMQLAQVAAAKALRRSAADAEADASALPPGSSRRRGPDPAREFVMLSREAGRLVILEANVAAGWPGSGRGRSVRADPPRTRAVPQPAPEKRDAPGREPPMQTMQTMQTIDEALEDAAVQAQVAAAAPPARAAAATGGGLAPRASEKPVPDGLRFGGVWRPTAADPVARRVRADAASGPDPPG